MLLLLLSLKPGDSWAMRPDSLWNSWSSDSVNVEGICSMAPLADSRKLDDEPVDDGSLCEDDAECRLLDVDVEHRLLDPEELARR